MTHHMHAPHGTGAAAKQRRRPQATDGGEPLAGTAAATDLPVHGAQEVAEALVVALGDARWPDGSLLVDLHPDVVRTHLAPALAAELHRVPGSVTAPTVVTRTDQQEGPE